MITGVRAQTRVGGRGKGLGLGHARRYGPFSWKEITKRRGQAHCNAILPGTLAPGRRRLQGMPGFKGDDSAVGRLKKSGGLVKTVPSLAPWPTQAQPCEAVVSAQRGAGGRSPAVSTGSCSFVRCKACRGRDGLGPQPHALMLAAEMLELEMVMSAQFQNCRQRGGRCWLVTGPPPHGRPPTLESPRARARV